MCQAHTGAAQGTQGGREMSDISGVPVSGLGEQRVDFRDRLCSQGALSSNSGSAISKLCRLGQVTNLSEPQFLICEMGSLHRALQRAKGACVGNGA